jgi:antitoxin HicB
VKTLDILFEGNSFRFEEVEEGGYFASVPDLPGCFSDGRTLDEAFANIQEALALVLESAAEDGLDVPERYQKLAAKAS